MKLKIICPTGLTKDAKIIDEDSGEELKNVTEFIIHGKAKDGIINATIKLFKVPLEITAEKKKRPKKSRFPSSTDYSISCISANEKTVMEGEGRVDLEYVKNKGIDSDNKLGWHLWQYFTKMFAENKQIKMKIPDITNYILINFSKDEKGLDFCFDRTTVNHNVNKFLFIGLLTKIKKRDKYIYSFAPIIKRKGLDWFRGGNKFMPGHFQSDNEGLFDLMKTNG